MKRAGMWHSLIWFCDAECTFYSMSACFCFITDFAIKAKLIVSVGRNFLAGIDFQSELLTWTFWKISVSRMMSGNLCVGIINCFRFEILFYVSSIYLWQMLRQAVSWPKSHFAGTNECLVLCYECQQLHLVIQCLPTYHLQLTLHLMQCVKLLEVNGTTFIFIILVL